MIEASKKWVTTPAECNTCGKKYQMVFETDVITMDGKETWKIPDDVVCNDCGSSDIKWPDYETEN